MPKCLEIIVFAERKEEWNEMVMSMTSPFKAIVLPGSSIWGLRAGPVFLILVVWRCQEAEIAASLDALATLKPEVAQKRGSILLNLKCTDVQVTPEQ